MASIKEYQRKIDSLKNTRKITGSMKMISSIKLQRMAKRNEAMLPYCRANRALLATIRSLAVPSPFLEGYKQPQRLHYLVFTSDRGMCGRFNDNTIRALLAHKQSSSAVAISCIGQRGYNFLKRHGENVIGHYDDIAAHPSFDAMRKVAEDCCNYFTEEKSQELWVVYSKRASSFSEEAVVERLLPFPEPENHETASDGTEFLLEEPPEELLRRNSLQLLQGLLYEALVTSGVAEHAARMSAMDNANNNCDRMSGNYTQLRNRARQAAITTELNEIVTGKEALQS